MQTLPSNAKPYFRSRVLSSLATGMKRQHVLRPGTWLQIRVLDGQLAVVDDREHARSICKPGATADIAPGVPHHAEALAQPVRFVVELYQVGTSQRASNDTDRWENEGGHTLP